MSKVNYAAIDIGSNAVRLLIKSINPETSEQLFTKELLLRVPLRLGDVIFFAISGHLIQRTCIVFSPLPRHTAILQKTQTACLCWSCSDAHVK